MDVSPAKRLSLTQLAKREGINVATAWRWAMKGCRGSRLATYTLGGRRFTTDDAFREFLAATNEKSGVRAPCPTAARQESIRRAKAELDADGI